MNKQTEKQTHKQTNKQLTNEHRVLMSLSRCAQTCNGHRSSLAYQFRTSSCNPNKHHHADEFTWLRCCYSIYISQIILTFWLVLTYDQLEDKHRDISLLYKTSKFHAAVSLLSNWSQETSKCGKNISDTVRYRLVYHFFVLTTIWRHLWSITEQTQGNLESIC